MNFKQGTIQYLSVPFSTSKNTFCEHLAYFPNNKHLQYFGIYQPLEENKIVSSYPLPRIVIGFSEFNTLLKTCLQIGILKFFWRNSNPFPRQLWWLFAFIFVYANENFRRNKTIHV